MPKHLADSIYSAGLGAYDPGGSRSTPSGAPDVCVADGGCILKLLEANLDEVFIAGAVSGRR